MTRFEDELLPPVDGKNNFNFIYLYFQLENERQQSVINSRLRTQIRRGLKRPRPYNHAIHAKETGQTNLSFNQATTQTIVETAVEPVLLEELRYNQTQKTKFILIEYKAN